MRPFRAWENFGLPFQGRRRCLAPGYWLLPRWGLGKGANVTRLVARSMPRIHLPTKTRGVGRIEKIAAAPGVHGTIVKPQRGDQPTAQGGADAKPWVIGERNPQALKGRQHNRWLPLFQGLGEFRFTFPGAVASPLPLAIGSCPFGAWGILMAIFPAAASPSPLAVG